MIQAMAEAQADFLMAKDAAELLHKHYPGHLWAVAAYGGVMTIKNLIISDKWGVALHIGNITDAGARKKKVIAAGGELLERANLDRGEYHGAPVEVLEGATKWTKPIP